MTKIIGLCGYMGSGKTTIAKASGLYRISFSDPIIDMMEAFGIPSKMLHDKTKWETPLDILEGKTIRHAAQTLGTEWGRGCIGQSVWSKRCIDRALNSGCSPVIIDNVRFEDEAALIKKSGGVIINFCESESMQYIKSSHHESEKSIHKTQLSTPYTFFNVKKDGIEANAARFIDFIKPLIE